MNSIGRGWRCCARSLHGYHRALRRVLRSSRAANAPTAAPAHAQLDALLFELEVDVGARASERGRASMTEVEEQLLYPTLVELHRTMLAIPPRDDPARWQPPLRAALSTIRSAVPRLREWCPGDRDA